MTLYKQSHVESAEPRCSFDLPVILVLERVTHPVACTMSGVKFPGVTKAGQAKAQ